MKAFIHFIPAKTLLLATGLLVIGWQPIVAQNQQTGVDQQPASSDDQTIVSAIAPYRDDVRRSILLASQQPQVLTSLAQQRASSQQAFTTVIQSYGQEKQSWFYDLSRYPDVMHELATLPAGSNESAVKNLTKNMPADLQESAWKLYRHHHDDLVQVDNLNQQAQQSFDNLIGPLDVPTQNAFRQLIDMPDVLTQLTDQIDKTTQLGQAYAANPDQVTKDLTALHDSLTVQNQQELADYQNELNNDPQAKQELQQAGQAYAQANGYNTGINPNPAWVNSGYYYQNPYPYFFGYPYWYTSAMWYPSAWWYGTGFYYGLGGNMVLFGLPGLGFSNWFFGPGRGVYPHLYNRFNNYYSRTIGERRILTPGNAGFITSARRAFGPVSGASRGNWLTNARQYSRPNSWSSSNMNTIRSAPSARYQNFNAGGYHTQSWGGGRSFGGGSFHSGGFHGGRR
ncbi:DUF3300 domain-containing protein [Spirosoma endophyticum]|uniref:DUF3300 domain-containing protein n=1 Tax=Spirosoma endophyticum TaxID=662367 RepID=A0A1I1FVS5_9BACT|nr:DUF3300 domain-containing protein [Spirosoma endophyticum]SFC03659.1 hypothetical protein SAMN05216167_101325 [Spirosoma endophyticum]